MTETSRKWDLLSDERWEGHDGRRWEALVDQTGASDAVAL